MPEYVTPGRSGAVVPPRRPDALADALERVLAAAPAMADAARADARASPQRAAARETAALLREMRGSMKVALDLRVLDDAGDSPSAGSAVTRQSSPPRSPTKASRSPICVGSRAGKAGADVAAQPRRSTARSIRPGLPYVVTRARPRPDQVPGPLPPHRAEAPAALRRGQARVARDRPVAGGRGRREEPARPEPRRRRARGARGRLPAGAPPRAGCSRACGCPTASCCGSAASTRPIRAKGSSRSRPRGRQATARRSSWPAGTTRRRGAPRACAAASC